MPPNDKQLAELLRLQHESDKRQRSIEQKVTQTATVVAQHIQEQRSHTRRIDNVITEIEPRVRELENWRAGIDQRLPGKLIDGKELHRDMAAINKKVDGLALKIAKWSGGVAALTTVVILILEAVIG